MLTSKMAMTISTFLTALILLMNLMLLMTLMTLTMLTTLMMLLTLTMLMMLMTMMTLMALMTLTTIKTLITQLTTLMRGGYHLYADSNQTHIGFYELYCEKRQFLRLHGGNFFCCFSTLTMFDIMQAKDKQLSKCTGHIVWEESLRKTKCSQVETAKIQKFR